MPLPFKEAFCIYARCTPGSFAREVLFCCLHPNARPFAALINWLEPQSTFHVLRVIGDSTTKEEFKEALSEYYYMQRLRGGFLANGLNIRLSTQFLAKLHEEVRRKEAAGTLEKL